MNHEFTLTTEYIQLNKLLKMFAVGESGGQIKHLITDGLIEVNGEKNIPIRKKLFGGEIVTYPTETITITVKKAAV